RELLLDLGLDVDRRVQVVDGARRDRLPDPIVLGEARARVHEHAGVERDAVDPDRERAQQQKDAGDDEDDVVGDRADTAAWLPGVLRAYSGRLAGFRHRLSSPGACSSSNAACSARTARSISSRATMHEILIGEVEIIRMFTFSVASVWNMRAATPGCERMPAPMSD